MTAINEILARGKEAVREYTQPELSRKLTELDFAVCGKCETRLPSPSRGGFDDCPTCNPDGEDLATILRLVGDQIHVDFIPVSDGVGLPPWNNCPEYYENHKEHPEVDGN